MVIIKGKMLQLLGGNSVACARVIFTVNAVVLKIGSADPEHSIVWKLHEIESFECCIYGEVSLSSLFILVKLY